MNFKVLFFLLYLVNTLSVYPQTASEVFEKYIKLFQEDNNFRTAVSYKIYKGLKSKTPYEVLNGEKRYLDYGYYERLGDVESIVGKDFYVQINHNDNILFFSNNNISFKGISGFDMSLLEPYFSILPLNVTKNNTYKIVFQLNADIQNFNYSQIEYYIDKKSYRLKKQVYYTTSMVDFSKQKNSQNLDIQRLEIIYSDYGPIDIKKEEKERYNKAFYIKSDESSQRGVASIELQPKYINYKLFTDN